MNMKKYTVKRSDGGYGGCRDIKIGIEKKFFDCRIALFTGGCLLYILKLKTKLIRNDKKSIAKERVFVIFEKMCDIDELQIKATWRVCI